MKKMGCMILAARLLTGLLAATASAQTNQGWKVCRNPVRVFGGGARVDLTPLFEWWGRQPLVVTNRGAAEESAPEPQAESGRPLSAWARVTGVPVAEVGASWVVDAVIYTSPTVHTNTRILLNHPPAVEAQTYAALRAQLEEAGREIAANRDAYSSDTNAAAQAEQRARAFGRSRSKLRADGVRDYSALAARDQNAAGDARNQVGQLEAAREEIERQLKAIPAINGVYHIDWFAVLQGHTKQGLPIYDLGLVSATPP
jgi:hypothetical protein